MSAEEIIAELPKLDPVDLEIVFQHLVDLRLNGQIEISPELAKAIDEALVEPETNDLSLDEAYRTVRSWNSK